MPTQMKQLTALDAQLVAIARPIKVLTHLAWPAHKKDEFLKGWRAKNPVLPTIEPTPYKLAAEEAAFSDIMQKCDRAHPVGEYIYQTAKSYEVAARMLRGVGTPAFTENSLALYGHPSDLLKGSSLTLLDAANMFIRATTDFQSSEWIEDQDICILPHTIQAEIQAATSAFFTDHEVKIVLDDNLASKAAAGLKKVRLRTATCFSRMDTPQLLQHECFVHTLTKINGKEQPLLKSMSLGAPRTTKTQEGLAIFGELVSHAIDLNRMRRIALRVKAVSIALEGGDFLDVFRFFLESGESAEESFQSSARVFRGGDVRGKVAFTKDIVYIGGILEVHTFLRKALQARKLEYLPYLFAGRLTLSDALSLAPYFESGHIAMPYYQPAWLKNLPALSAFLLYTVFINELDLSEVKLASFADAPYTATA